jgi:hypothetical protein
MSFVEFRDTFLPRHSLQRTAADPFSPQGNALKWLQDDVHKSIAVLQQYSLAVVYFALSGSKWANSTYWLSKEDECQWMIVTESASAASPCDEDGRFVNL